MRPPHDPSSLTRPRPAPARLVVGIVAAVVAMAAAAAVGPVAPASSGGSVMDPAQDRYEAGDRVTLVGYAGAGTQGGVEDGPYHGHLRVDPGAATADAPDTWPFVHPTDIPLGPATVAELRGGTGWPSMRVAITFDLPTGLTPGAYEAFLCDDPCTTGLGDLIGALVYVGVDPPHRIDRAWPADDPAVALVPDDDLVGGRPAAEVRAELAAPRPAAPPPTEALAPTEPVATTGTAPAPTSGDERADATAGAPAEPATDAETAPAERRRPWFPAGVALALALAGLSWLVRRRSHRHPAHRSPDAPVHDPRPPHPSPPTRAWPRRSAASTNARVPIPRPAGPRRDPRSSRRTPSRARGAARRRRSAPSRPLEPGVTRGFPDLASMVPARPDRTIRARRSSSPVTMDTTRPGGHDERRARRG